MGKHVGPFGAIGAVMWLAFAAGCSGGGPAEAGVHIRVIGGPAPVAPLADVHVRLELADGHVLETTTSATGEASFAVAASTAPWDLTVARSGYTATSFVAIDTAPAGDIRIDRRAVVTPVPAGMVRGHVTGIPAGTTVRIDTYNFETTNVGPDGSYSGNYFGASGPPLRMYAVALDSTGRAVSAAVAPDAPRDGTTHTIDIALPTAPTPTTSTVDVVLPTTGLLAGLHVADAHTFGGVDLLPMSDGLWAASGGGSIVASADGATWTSDVFPGLAASWAFANIDTTMDAAGVTYRLNFGWHVLDGGHHTLAVGELRRAPVVVGTSLADLRVDGDASGFDTLVLHVGEDLATPPAWLIFYDPEGTARHVPGLPTGITLSDLGVMEGAPTSTLPMLIAMYEHAPAWTSQPYFSQVPEYGVTCAGGYVNVQATAPHAHTR